MSITPIEKVLYTAKAHTTGGRDGGASRTSDGRLDVKLSVPGGAGTGTNPEQLFAVGWSACFASAIKLVGGPLAYEIAGGICGGCGGGSGDDERGVSASGAAACGIAGG